MAKTNTITSVFPPPYPTKAKMLEIVIGIDNRSELFRYLIDKEFNLRGLELPVNTEKQPE